MRPYLQRLEADKIPYFTRTQSALDPGCDVFVQLPNNGIIVELACGAAGCCPPYIRPKGWDLCQPVASPPRERALEAEDARGETHDALANDDAPPPPSGAPSMWPWKMTFASSDPEAAADFAVRALGATHIPHPPSLSDKCGRVRWVRFQSAEAWPRGGYQLCVRC